MIIISNCKHGHLYKINSRNLTYGVFNSKNNGFIGIREKFKHKFLFTEYHWDTGEPFGTAKPLEEIEKIPDNIEIKESMGTVDSKTKKPIYFQDGKGWLFDNGEKCEGFATYVENQKLFQYLEKFQEK
jgi:hypothetical protein